MAETAAGSGVRDGIAEAAIDVAAGVGLDSAALDATPLAEQPVNADTTTARASSLMFMMSEC